jgi:hypothetical protein
MPTDLRDPIRNAAVWFVAAFGLLASALLAGVNLSGDVLSASRHPAWVVGLVVVSVGSAVAVIVEATRVLLPAASLEQLADLEDEERGRLQRGRPADKQAVTWVEVATRNAVGVLNHLATDRGHEKAPVQLRSELRQGESVSAEVARMVADADAWQTSRAFGRLRRVTFVATALILAAVLAWQPVTRHTNEGTPDQPLPVTVTLRKSPSVVIGHGCTARKLIGVAILGSLDRNPLIALPPQADCRAAIVTVTKDLGWVEAR